MSKYEKNKEIQKNSLRVYVESKDAINELILQNTDYKRVSMFIRDAIQEKIHKDKLSNKYKEILKRNHL